MLNISSLSLQARCRSARGRKCSNFITADVCVWRVSSLKAAVKYEEGGKMHDLCEASQQN